MNSESNTSVWELLANLILPPAMSLPLTVVAYQIQENFYDRFNQWQGVSQALGNPNFLTSFAYPLGLMYCLRSVAVWCEEQNRSLNHTALEKVFQASKWVIPAGVALLGVAHEVISKPRYVDDPLLDVLATFSAGTLYFGIELVGSRLFHRRRSR